MSDHTFDDDPTPLARGSTPHRQSATVGRASRYDADGSSPPASATSPTIPVMSFRGPEHDQAVGAAESAADGSTDDDSMTDFSDDQTESSRRRSVMTPLTSETASESSTRSIFSLHSSRT